MVRGYKAALFGLLLVILATLGQAAQQGDTAEDSLLDRLAESSPAYTEAQANAYVREVLPFVEQIAGRKFKTPPVIKLVRRDDLYPIMTKELAPRMKRLCPTLTKDQLDIATQSTADIICLCALGKYATDTGRLYLLPRNLKPLMSLAEADPKYAQQIVKLVIAHELAHALQDQQLNIGKLESHLTSTEEQLAFSATLEGFGMFMGDTVADKLHMDAAAKEMARLMASGSFKNMDPAEQISAEQALGTIRDIYIGGRDFVAWHFHKGGTEQIWRVLAAPPTSTSMIYRPETYSTEAKAELDYSSVLKGLERKLVKGKWKVTTQPLGELELRVASAGMNSKDMETILGDVEQVYRLNASGGASEIRIDLTVLRDTSAAPLLISATERLVQGTVARMSTSEIYKLTPCAPADFTPMKGKADIARRFSFAVSSKGTSYPISFVDIVRGRVAVQVYAGGVTIPDAKIVDMFEELWKRLPAQDR